MHSAHDGILLFPFFQYYMSLGDFLVCFFLVILHWLGFQICSLLALIWASFLMAYFRFLNFYICMWLRFLVEHIIRNESFLLDLSIFMVMNIMFYYVFLLRWYIILLLLNFNVVSYINTSTYYWLWCFSFLTLIQQVCVWVLHCVRNSATHWW